MSITTLSSRDLNQDTSRAKRAAKKGPVFITDRGKPAFVLLSMENYNKMTQQEKNLAEMLAMPEGTPDFDFDPPRMGDIFREVDLG